MPRNDIKVIIDTEALCAYTLKVTNNLNNFPKKYRFTVVDELVRKSMEIYDRVQDANSSWNPSMRVQNIEYAISSCHKMKMLLRLVQEVIHPKCSISYWDSMIDNVERQLMNWRKFTKQQIS